MTVKAGSERGICLIHIQTNIVKAICNYDRSLISDNVEAASGSCGEGSEYIIFLPDKNIIVIEEIGEPSQKQTQARCLHWHSVKAKSRQNPVQAAFLPLEKAKPFVSPVSLYDRQLQGPPATQSFVL